MPGDMVRAEAIEIGKCEMLADPIHLRREIVHHSVGFGMTGSKTHQLAIGDQIEPREFLGLHHRHHRVTQHQAEVLPTSQEGTG